MENLCEINSNFTFNSNMLMHFFCEMKSITNKTIPWLNLNSLLFINYFLPSDGGGVKSDCYFELIAAGNVLNWTNLFKLHAK